MFKCVVLKIYIFQMAMVLGTAADMMIHPFGAIVVGSAAGIVSVLGTVYLTVIEIDKHWG